MPEIQILNEHGGLWDPNGKQDIYDPLRIYLTADGITTKAKMIINLIISNMNIDIGANYDPRNQEVLCITCRLEKCKSTISLSSNTKTPWTKVKTQLNNLGIKYFNYLHRRLQTSANMNNYYMFGNYLAPFGHPDVEDHAIILVYLLLMGVDFRGVQVAEGRIVHIPSEIFALFGLQDFYNKTVI